MKRFEPRTRQVNFVLRIVALARWTISRALIGQAFSVGYQRVGLGVFSAGWVQVVQLRIEPRQLSDCNDRRGLDSKSSQGRACREQYNL
jgi:hypothetical protein